VPEITAVETQKKNPQRVNIFLDNRFAFAIRKESFLEQGLKRGKIITDDEIDRILKKEDFFKLQDIAIRFLNYRPRSEKELKDHLAKKISQKEGIRFSQAVETPGIDRIVSKLKKYKFINDLEFAKWFLDSRLRTRPKSLKVIAYELKTKGIDGKIIETVLGKSHDEKSLAIKAASKKIKRWQKLSQFEFKKKLYQFLLSRGFDYETVKEVFAFFQKKR